MKPDWSNAPPWAWWLAMDDDGFWYWFDKEPEYLAGGVWWTHSLKRLAAKPETEAMDSLEPKP